MAEGKPLQVAFVDEDGSCTLVDLPSLRHAFATGEHVPTIEFVRNLTEQEILEREHTASPWGEGENPFFDKHTALNEASVLVGPGATANTFELTSYPEWSGGHYDGPPRNRAEKRKARYTRKGKGKHHET